MIATALVLGKRWISDAPTVSLERASEERVKSPVEPKKELSSLGQATTVDVVFTVTGIKVSPSSQGDAGGSWIRVATNLDGLPNHNIPLEPVFSCGFGDDPTPCTHNDFQGTFYPLAASPPLAFRHPLNLDALPHHLIASVQFEVSNHDPFQREDYRLDLDLSAGTATPFGSTGFPLNFGHCYRHEGEIVDPRDLGICAPEDLCTGPEANQLPECAENCLLSVLSPGWELCYTVEIDCPSPTIACTASAGPPPCDGVPGTRTCSASGVGQCVMTPDFTPELGNGVDDDCDMIADECNPGQTSLACTANVGSLNCAVAPGTAPCGGGPCVATPDLVPEVLNGFDDDGDCIADECNPGQLNIACTAPLRACSAWPGTAPCAGGVPGVCAPSAADVANPLICKFGCLGGATNLDTDADGNPDNDGDGLWDCWEDEGGIDADGLGGLDLVLPATDRNHKNLYLEIDYMLWHQPQVGTSAAVTAAFAAAPVANPDGINGITLTILEDDLLQDAVGNSLHATVLSFQAPGAAPCRPPPAPCSCNTGPPAGGFDFDFLKSQAFGGAFGWFGTAAERSGPRDATGVPWGIQAKKLVYRYAIFAHDLANDTAGTPQQTSGCGETRGNDFVVSLGTTWFTHDAMGMSLCGPGAAPIPGGGTSNCVQRESGTLMHEFGHNLGLGHGGNDNINCKPNYPSVMNYAYTIPNQFAPNPLNYSSGLVGPLVENALSEAAGVGPGLPMGFVLAYGPPNPTTLFPEGWNLQTGDYVNMAITLPVPLGPGRVDWNQDGRLTPATVARDINAFGNPPGCPANVDTDGDGIPDDLNMDGAPDWETMNDFDDWSNLVYDFTTLRSLEDGVRPDVPVERPPLPMESPDSDGDGPRNLFDNCVFVPNPDQADADGDGVGDACPIVPIAECVQDAGGGSFVAAFGYRNLSAGVAWIGKGPLNGFHPEPADRGQVEQFSAGRVIGAFSTTFDGAPLLWRVGSRHAVAAADLPSCSGDDDVDGVPNLFDNCVFVPNPGQEDSDADGVGDACPETCDDGLVNQGESDLDCGGPCGATCLDGELCVTDEDCAGGLCEEGFCDGDEDGDGVPDTVDNCPTTFNPAQEDFDSDGQGDACDADLDGDGVLNVSDNCPALPNPTQADFDADGLGDACDPNSIVADAGPDQIKECTGNGKALVTLNGTASGAPSGNLSYKWTAPVTLNNSTQVIATGNFAVGTATVSLKVSQGFVFKTDTALVTVLDTAPPSLTAPPDVVSATCTGVALGQATAVDGCGGSVSISHDAPASFKAGVTLVTWRAIDQYGNVATKTQKVTLGLGDNTACCPTGSNVIVGTSNNDTLNGTSGRDCILGKGAQDIIKGFGGDDVLSGGDGDDVMEGGDGNDVIQGGTGQDVLKGQNGTDALFGDDGDDQCWGGAEDDATYGGQGQDLLYGEGGNDRLFGDSGDDRLEGGAGDDLLNGGTNNDTCLGGTGSNTLLSCEWTQ